METKGGFRALLQAFTPSAVRGGFEPILPPPLWITSHDIICSVDRYVTRKVAISLLNGYGLSLKKVASRRLVGAASQDTSSPERVGFDQLLYFRDLRTPLDILKDFQMCQGHPADEVVGGE